MVELLARLRLEGSLTLTLKVVPKSSCDEVIGFLDNGSLKVKVTAAPDKGKANAAVCALLASAFGVAQSKVELLRGLSSSTKQVRISA
ncbi:MAG: DUF167 domain-containing protein [Bryobacteraceae bacterium]|nr:DUF167 domain-containing protein [Bryobacteraceae bacterium]